VRRFVSWDAKGWRTRQLGVQSVKGDATLDSIRIPVNSSNPKLQGAMLTLKSTFTGGFMPHRCLSIFLAFTTPTLGVLLVHGQSPQASQSTAASTHGPASPAPVILQESDGEHRLRRPGGLTRSSSVADFVTKIDEQNGNAEDFYVGAEVLNPGAMIPLHKHHNSEEVVILEEGSAAVTVGDKRAVAGPHSFVFIPRETWVSIPNTGNGSIHLYGLFSRQGFENFLRARRVRPGEPLTPLTPEEVRRAADERHVTPWHTSKGPYPPGVPQPCVSMA
jgi:mannose-6-phosphate isomerase-like protein (cupin superfamily)